MIMKKNEIEKENIIPSSHRRKMVPSIPVSICSSNVKAIQELIEQQSQVQKNKEIKV